MTRQPEFSSKINKNPINIPQHGLLMLVQKQILFPFYDLLYYLLFYTQEYNKMSYSLFLITHSSRQVINKLLRLDDVSTLVSPLSRGLLLKAVVEETVPLTSKDLCVMI